MSWQPSASLSALQQRAILLQRIRQFFLERQVLELDVPVLSPYAATDPFIDSMETSVMGAQHYLQTSPEFFLKRFLATHAQDVYYLGKAFRQGEKGHRHNPEFTLLEWYRVNWDEQQLMCEVKALIGLFCTNLPWTTYSYQALFQRYLSLDPHTASLTTIKACAKSRINCDIDSHDRNPWLDLLWTHCIEPELPDGLTGIYDYPVSQAALAQIKTNSQGQRVAKRFEIYLNGLELANGYRELGDADEQRHRFEADQYYRQQQALPYRPYDQQLVDGLRQGKFPNCAGVALGIDRLLMCWLKKATLQEVVSFA